MKLKKNDALSYYVSLFSILVKHRYILKYPPTFVLKNKIQQTLSNATHPCAIK